MSGTDDKGGDLDLDWDDALADWEREIEDKSQAVSEPMPQKPAAAPAMRRSTTVPGVHPASMSAFANGPDVPNAALDSRSASSPVPRCLRTASTMVNLPPDAPAPRHGPVAVIDVRSQLLDWS